MWWWLAGCGPTLPELRTEPAALAPEPPEPTRDTGAWFVDTGGRPSCLASCDLECDGQVDASLVTVRQPSGAELAFTDLGAALAVAESGAVVTACPGTYSALATVERDLALVAWDSGADRPVFVPDGPGTVLTIGSGVSVTLIGLAIDGGCEAPEGGSGAGGSGFSGGSGAGAAPLSCDGSTGIVVGSGATLDARHLRVRGHPGGGVRAVGSTSVSVRDSRIVGNRGVDGAGLALDRCGAAWLDAVSIVGNAASGDGGGLWASDCPVEAGPGGVALVGNEAARGGGAYAVFSDLGGASWWVSDGLAGAGGGVYLQYGTLDATELRIERNAAGIGGGALVDGAGWLGAALVASNVAELGGGLYVQADTFELSADVTSNVAAEGGGLYVAYGAVHAAGARVTDNVATRGEGGGASVQAGSTLSADRTDWGGPSRGDNAPPDVFPAELGVNEPYDTGACFTCDAAGCTPCS